MHRKSPDRESALALLLTWLAPPLIVIGISLLAAALAFAGALAALCSAAARTVRTALARASLLVVPLPGEPRRVPARYARPGQIRAWRDRSLR